MCSCYGSHIGRNRVRAAVSTIHRGALGYTSGYFPVTPERTRPCLMAPRISSRVVAAPRAATRPCASAASCDVNGESVAPRISRIGRCPWFFLSAERSPNSYCIPVTATFRDQLHFPAPFLSTHDAHLQYHNLLVCLVFGSRLRFCIYRFKNTSRIKF